MAEILPNDEVPTPVVPSDLSESKESSDPSWWLSEGVPGEGSRPKWLNEKFKTVQDMATSYGELEKKVVTEAAPDEYDFSKSKFLDGSSDSFDAFKEMAKNKRVSQEVIDQMIDSVDKYMDSFSTDFKAEAEKLGPDGKQRLEVLDNWTKELLSKENYEALTLGMNSAGSIKALEQLRGKMMENKTTIPNGNDASSSAAPDLADVQAELSANLDKYKSDPAYRKEISRKIELASKDSNFVDKNAV